MPKKFIAEDDEDEPSTSKMTKYQKKRKKLALPDEDYLTEDSIPNRDTSFMNDSNNMSSNLEDGSEQRRLHFSEDLQEQGLSGDKTEKKKPKKEKKPKAKPPLPKKKGPLNLDKQCGVLILPDNIVCTRSLTCKIHSMGAKRAVEGRSQPFNDLLAAYQKKNTGRAAQGAAQQQTDKAQQHRSSPSVSTDKIAPTAAAFAVAGATASSSSTAASAAAELDSDEETENVLLAIKQSKPMPLGQKRYYHVRRRRAYFKLRDILLDAITPKLSGPAGLSASDATQTISSDFSSYFNGTI